MTDDKGFRDSAEILHNKFNERTGKTITIQDNSFYKTLLETSLEIDITLMEPQKLAPLPDVGMLREKIHETVSSICEFSGYDGWNNYWCNTFTLRTMATIGDVEAMFNGLRSVIQDNFFETEIPASKILSMEGVENETPIPIDSLQETLTLYEDIRDKMSGYLPQFISVAMNVINKRYKETQKFVNIDDDDLPF